MLNNAVLEALSWEPWKHKEIDDNWAMIIIPYGHQKIVRLSHSPCLNSALQWHKKNLASALYNTSATSWSHESSLYCQRCQEVIPEHCVLLGRLEEFA